MTAQEYGWPCSFLTPLDTVNLFLLMLPVLFDKAQVVILVLQCQGQGCILGPTVFFGENMHNFSIELYDLIGLQDVLIAEIGPNPIVPPCPLHSWDNAL